MDLILVSYLIKMEKPVAIVMITRNGGKHISAAIDSILKNTEYPFKLIILNGGSTDNTKGILSTYQFLNPTIIETHHLENI